MTRPSWPHLDLQTRLNSVATNGRSSSDIAARAKDHLAALTRPVSLSILTPTQVDRAHIVNFLVGQSVIPPTDFCDVLRLGFSEQEELSVEQADGTTVRHSPPFDLSALAVTGSKAVSLALPLTALTKISILATSALAATDQTEAEIDWLAAQTDIAIWCTDSFDAADQRVWARIPDRLRDHTILVLLESGALYSEAEDSLRATYGSEFLGIVRLSPEDASRARLGGTLDKALFNASGGQKLISILKRDIDAARGHAMGQAELFLQGTADLMVAADAKIDRTADRPVEPAPPEQVQNAPPAEQSDVALNSGIQGAIHKLSRLGEFPGTCEEFSTPDFLSEMANVLEEIELDLDALPDDEDVQSPMQMLRELIDLVELYRLETDRADASEAVMAAIQLKREFFRALSS